MARRVRRETERLWQDRVKRQAASGRSIREFCDQEGISQASFYAWRRRFREQATGAASRAATRRSVPDPPSRESPGAGDFIPLRLLDRPTVWEVMHPCGYRVRVSGQVAATTLQCSVEVLDGRRHG